VFREPQSRGQGGDWRRLQRRQGFLLLHELPEGVRGWYGEVRREGQPSARRDRPGEAIDAGTKITVNGASVAFCCDMCKAKASESKDQIELIFNDKAFEKAGFKVAEKKE
jgi:hypothetical protein